MTTAATSVQSTFPFDLEKCDFFSRFQHDSELNFAQNLYSEFKSRNEVISSASTAVFPPESKDLNLLYSILALQEYFRQNWLGPRSPFPHPFFDYIKAKTNGKTLLSLVIDGEYPYRLTKQPELLIFALDQLEVLQKDSDRFTTWWYLRALYLHQRIVDCASPTLRSKIISTLKTEICQVFTAQEALEAANLAQECEDEKLAQFYLDESARLAGIKHSFIGKLGRRTIHQTFDVYQLTVSIDKFEEQEISDCCTVESTCCAAESTRGTVESSCCIAESSSAACSAQPKNVALNDDMLRETVTFTEEETPGKEKQVRHLDLAILLANARQFWRFHARDTEINEKVDALIQKVLEAPNSWQIYSAGLFWRSKLEADRGRTMERACLQFKALAEQVDYVSADSFDRFDWSFAVYFPTEWDCDREQGLLFAGLGAFKTALEIFERREMFEEAVQCLLNLGRIEDAENIVVGQLEKLPEDARLICVLGDIKRAVWEGKIESNAGDKDEAFKIVEETYQRAWSISGNRLAKAQRALGSVYYLIADYAKVRACMAKAVAINPLFESSWFLLGFASVQLEDYEGALRAFTRLINLNQDNPEAWKNIANCQVKLGKLDEAHRALAQVTRLQFEVADGWLSLFSVSLSIGEPLDAIRSLRRYIEILIQSSSESSNNSFTPKESAKIIEMISQLCDLVIRVCMQSEERIRNDPNYREMTLPVKRQFDNFLLDFLGQTNMASVSEFWLQVARYLKADRWPLHAPQCREALLKAYRCLQSRPYDRDSTTFRLITQIISGLKDIAAVEEAPTNELDLMVRTVKRRCKESFEGTPEYESL